MDDAVAGGDVFEVSRFLQLHLVFKRRKPHRLVSFRLGHDDHAAVLVEDAEHLFVCHPRRDLLRE